MELAQHPVPLPPRIFTPFQTTTNVTDVERVIIAIRVYSAPLDSDTFTFILIV